MRIFLKRRRRLPGKYVGKEILMKRGVILCACLGLLGGLLAGCGQGDSPPAQDTRESLSEEDPEETNDTSQYHKMKVDTETTYQTMESFGTSGAWWSQYVGGFTESVDDSGLSSRERIATLLFDKEQGIGLTCYRFNLGAGSAESRKGSYSDIHRRAQSFEVSEGVYDFDKDANAVWFLEKAVELGVEEVVLFCNSPLERLTDNGKAHLDQGMKSNISEENYKAFAVYVMDAVSYTHLTLPTIA